MWAALIASILAALGGVLLFFLPRLFRGLYDTLLVFSAGVALAAGSITLLGPALYLGLRCAHVQGLPARTARLLRSRETVARQPSQNTASFKSIHSTECEGAIAQR